VVNVEVMKLLNMYICPTYEYIQYILQKFILEIKEVHTNLCWSVQREGTSETPVLDKIIILKGILKL